MVKSRYQHSLPPHGGAQTSSVFSGRRYALKDKLENYIKEEYPYYSEADIVVETKDERVENTVTRVLKAIDDFYIAENKNAAK